MQQAKKYPTRREAINTLDRLLDSRVIDQNLCEDILDIMQCIEEEEEGLSLWGSEVSDPLPDDVHFIHTNSGLFVIYPKDEAERLQYCYKALRERSGEE